MEPGQATGDGLLRGAVAGALHLPGPDPLGPQPGAQLQQHRTGLLGQVARRGVQRPVRHGRSSVALGRGSARVACSLEGSDRGAPRR
ncbi:hypothetical protein [Ornithinimicrobium kibberense]|uniref:hypothetical protein n=1 Tax=Ornithinimicrobium kibberense TaxID=282060 RepID=UPI00360C64E9